MKLSQQIINPLEVHGPTIEGEVQPLNYKRIALDMIDSSPLESLTCSALKTAYKRKNIDFPVVFERDLIIGQRDFGQVITALENGSSFVYILTSLRPGNITLAHHVLLTFCSGLQRCYHIPVIVQVCDIEKFYLEELVLEDIQKLYHDMVPQILSCGFDQNITYIFSNIQNSQFMYPNIIKIQKLISVQEIMDFYSLTINDIAGFVTHPSYAIAATFASSIPSLATHSQAWRCLCIYFCEKDVHYRLARNIACNIGETPPATLALKIFPGLRSVGTNMLLETAANSIFMVDTAAVIRKKINSCLSGGRETIEEHRKLASALSTYKQVIVAITAGFVQGAIIEKDVAIEMFRFLCPTSNAFHALVSKYENGLILSGEMKKEVIAIIQEIVISYQRGLQL
ncbi:tryptophan--tRNA ligase, cytoplasmic-like [Zophobas morio]|uniref:tryptophan--tRNA ligase, cytoplasmic-like n=1 Tax=Zophobas morio TaxID=2755281 RepID=UPI003082EA1D